MGRAALMAGGAGGCWRGHACGRWVLPPAPPHACGCWLGERTRLESLHKAGQGATPRPSRPHQSGGVGGGVGGGSHRLVGSGGVQCRGAAVEGPPGHSGRLGLRSKWRGGGTAVGPGRGRGLRQVAAAAAARGRDRRRQDGGAGAPPHLGGRRGALGGRPLLLQGAGGHGWAGGLGGLGGKRCCGGG